VSPAGATLAGCLFLVPPDSPENAGAPPLDQPTLAKVIAEMGMAALCLRGILSKMTQNQGFGDKTGHVSA
jgi:hypothetical protein